MKSDIMKDSSRNIRSKEKIAKEELNESEKSLQNLFNLIPAPVVIADAKGKILMVNNAIEEKTGFKRKELVGRNFIRIKIFTKKTKALLMKNLIKLMRGTPIEPHEIEVLTKDGGKLWAEIKPAKIKYEGKPAVLGVFRDITERKKLELQLKKYSENLEQKVKEQTEQLRESEEFSSSLLGNSTYPILVANEDTSIKYVNPALEKLTCFSSTEVLGKKVPYPW